MIDTFALGGIYFCMCLITHRLAEWADTLPPQTTHLNDNERTWVAAFWPITFILFLFFVVYHNLRRTR